MNSLKNYYEILGINPTFENDDPLLKKKYRELCLKHHPDQNPDDPASEERFKEIAEAYEVLSDPVKRRSYDMQSGHNPSVPNFGSPGAFGDAFSSFNGFWPGGGFGSPVDDLFRSSGPVFRRQIIQNVNYNLTFLDIFNGTTINLDVTMPDGSISKEKIKIEPRTLVQKRSLKTLSDGTSVILNFVPKAFNDKKIISKDAFEIEMDDNLNTIVTYKIPFILALRGGSLSKRILNVPISIEIPKACEHGHIIPFPDLSLTKSCKMFVSLKFETPNVSLEKVDQIESILAR